MTFLAPLAFSLSVLAVPIVAMYVLKLRRQQRPVSSTLLWRRALDDVQANAPWQRLRTTMLLLLQLLTLAALVLALACPAYSHAEAFAGDLVVIVDQSYEMQAHDVAPSRFAVALAHVHNLARELGSGNVMSVIGMGAEPHLVIAQSDDQGAIAHAIDELHVGVSPPNFLSALSLAASLARSGQNTRIVVLTSRDSGIDGLPIGLPYSVEIVRIGGQLHDLGITAFSAAHVGVHTVAVLRVSNFGTQTTHSDLQLFVGEGSISKEPLLADVRPLTVSPGREQTLFWTNLPANVRWLRAHLTVRDDFSADKTAWTIVPLTTIHYVLLVTKGDYFLQTALSSDPALRLTTAQPSVYTSVIAQRYDLVIFDGWLPPALPATSTLLVSPPSGRVGPVRFGDDQIVGPVSAASGLAASTGNTVAALLHYVDLSDVHILRARAVTLPGWMQPIVVSGTQTLVAAGDNGTTRVALFTFNLPESDWPLRVSFPIFIQNLLQYLTPGLVLGSPNVTAGQALTLLPRPGTRAVEIVRSDGIIDHLQPPFPPFTDTTRPGLYTLRTVGGARQTTMTFAVNFFPARATPATGPEVLWFGHAHSGSMRAVTVPITIAWVFGLLALALLTTEWWFAFRR
jgi:Ca-activated chloride channel family protein